MKLRYLICVFALILAGACQEKESQQEEAAPVLVSTSPENGASDISDSSLSIVFTFDQKVRCLLDAQKGITVDGGASVSKVEAYGNNLTVSLYGLARGNSYTLTLPEGAVQGYKTNQKGSSAILFRFSTKAVVPPTPGSWEDAATCVKNMGVGWNLGNTLESNSGDVDNMWIEGFTGRTATDYETAWGQPVATRELIHMFKEAGFNTIRVPVTWYPHMGTVSVTVSDGKGHWDMSTWKGYDIDPVWMARVKDVVNYVLDEGMYCVLNVHHDTGSTSTGWLRADKAVHASVRERYCALWEQIATEFQSCGPNLVFESFNEMLDTKNTWNYSTTDAHEAINLYNADFVATVRATGGNNASRNLILNTYSASCQPQALKDFRLPEDTVEGHLLAEVHSYAPYRFAFNPGPGETWKPITTFDANCEKEVQAIIEDMNTYLVSKGIPCVLGEFGADTRDGEPRKEDELAKQAKCYVSAAAKYNIACLYWMGLSDGADRSVPTWTMPKVKNAILNAYQDR